MATPAAHPRSALPDAELARLAGGGDGEAFTVLYDRHEQRVYGFCMRLLCSADDAAEATQETFVRMLTRLPALRERERELEFIAYTLAAARNACYDMIARRRKVQPVADELQLEPAGPPEGHAGALERDPERRALLEASRTQVRAANAALPPRQREVLALREVEGLSYEQIGALMGLNRNAVAQLISRARLKLASLLRGGALASVAAASPECERALPLLAALQDGQVGDEREQLAWAREHLRECDTCKVSRAAMEEAGVSYRALGPILALAWLRKATIARAAEAVGADWSHLVARAPGPGGGGPDGTRGVRGWLAPPERRGRAAGVVLGVLLCAILALLAATGITREGAVRARTLTLVNPPARPTSTAVLHPAVRARRLARRPRAGHAGRTGGAPLPHRTPTATTPRAPAGHHPPPRHTAAVVRRPSRHAATRPRHKTPAARHPPPGAATPPPATTQTPPPTTTTTPTTPSTPTTTATTPTPTTTETTATHPEEPPAPTPGGPPGGGLIP